MTVHPLVTAEPGTRAYYAQIAAAARAVSRAARRVPAPPASPSRPPTAPGTKRCSRCGRVLPLSEFRTKADPRCSRTGTSSDCNACHRAYNASLRRRDAAAKGRAYRTREDITREQEARKAARLERWKRWQDEQSTRRRARMEAARKSRISCSVCGCTKRRRAFRASSLKAGVLECAACAREHERRRYASDPEYHAKVKAKKIRRKRALAAAYVQPVNYEVVAERDRWRCGICGKKVTRRTWSLDHIDPLSAGGEHSYRRVVLAHRRCNSARGAGRLPVQAPLFAGAAP